MRSFAFVVALAASVTCCSLSTAARDSELPAATSSGTPLAVPLDAGISGAIAGITPERLKAIDTRLVAFGTRSTFSEHAGSKRGVFAARDWLARAFDAIARDTHGRMRVTFDTYLQHPNGKSVPRDVTISSVVATLYGDEPGNRTYVMSSHFDSRNSSAVDARNAAPGADDNGSGTAAVLEAARVLAPLRLHATLVFATFDAEEQGLFGSAHFAQALKNANVDVAGDLNNDIVGASTGPQRESNPHTIRIFSQAMAAGADPQAVNAVGNENDSPSRELARAVKTLGDAYEPELRGLLVARADRFLRGGDHESFNAAGFPAIRFTEPVESFAHQHQDVRTENGVAYGDLQQYMDFAYLARVARYNAGALAALAAGPAQPHDAAILTKELTNSTTLTWSPVGGAASYEVLRRATTDAQWTSAIDVGDVTSATVPYSKDNWLFGIRAVGASGQRSVVAFPTPRRS